jgi:hypothetical protein
MERVRSLAARHKARPQVEAMASAIEKYLQRPHGREVEDSLRGMRVYHVPWEILPPGRWTFADLIGHIHRLRLRYPEYQWEEERLLLVRGLAPLECYVGSDEFEGYFAFTFAGTERALLEHPIRGNAVYIIERDWRSLCQLPKYELLTEYGHEVGRVIHRGDWELRLRRLLDGSPESCHGA